MIVVAVWCMFDSVRVRSFFLTLSFLLYFMEM